MLDVAKIEIDAKTVMGGNSNFGTGGEDGAIMIDLKNLLDFEMNEETWEASFGPGYRLGKLDEQLHDHGGRAIAHGTCPSVGVGGHATIVS
jgi:FAD/FMN-containing dehydrogenase